ITSDRFHLMGQTGFAEEIRRTFFTRPMPARRGRSAKVVSSVADFLALTCWMPLPGLLRDRTRSSKHWSAPPRMAAPVGRFSLFISTGTKAALMMFFFLIKLPVWSRAASLTGQVRSLERPTADSTGRHYFSIKQSKASRSLPQPVALRWAPAAESCTAPIVGRLGLIKQVEPLQVSMMSLLPAML